MSDAAVNNETSVITAEEDGPVKSAKQLKKEAEKAAKLQKLQEKLNKQAATAAASSTKEKSEVRIVCMMQCPLKLTYLTTQSLCHPIITIRAYAEETGERN